MDLARQEDQQAAVAYLERVAADSDVLGSKSRCASDENECANCGAPEGHDGLELRPCSRCKLVAYCDKACQTQHWKAGGHKQRCLTVSERSVTGAQAAISLSETLRDSEKCAICLEPLDSGATQTPCCGHELHIGCVNEMKASGRLDLSCPICG